MKCGAVIVAAGKGERLKASNPKAFVSLASTPLYKHSLEVFLSHPKMSEVVLVVPAEKVSHVPNSRYKVVKGGLTRQESVMCGLEALGSDCDHVLVHDAARPFVTHAIIDRLLETLAAGLCGIAAWPVADTLKATEGATIVKTVDRKNLWAAQTPQAFPVKVLREALEKAKAENFVGTDEASVVERLKIEVRVVAGDARNIKITNQEDLALAQIILKSAL